MASERIIVNVVKGAEGPSLQVLDKKGSGERVAGPKAWGNPFNKPVFSFEVDANGLVAAINNNKYIVGDDK